MKRNSKLYRIIGNYITLFRSFSHQGISSDRFQFSQKNGLIMLSALGCFFGLSLWGGYQLAMWKVRHHEGAFAGEWQAYLQSDRHQIKDLEMKTHQHLQVLTQHVGKIEANLMRINALGERLVQFAHFDPQEFNFNHEVGMGGPMSKEIGNEALLTTLQDLGTVLDRRYVQMSVLHQALQNRWRASELSFAGAGKAVTKGWISSFFGARTDPFTGKKVWHSGVDIVGKEGSEIKALASGVVSFAETNGGYGRMVEIKHANGLSTRYGHNKELLVRPGQVVRKGEAIALLGSTGRSTGPHCHLEVHKNGKAVDPGLFFPDFQRR